MRLIIVLLLWICSWAEYQLDPQLQAEWNLYSKAEYYARMCKDNSSIRIDIMNTSILKSEKDSHSSHTIILTTNEVIDIDFNDHQIAIVLKSAVISNVSFKIAQ